MLPDGFKTSIHFSEIETVCYLSIGQTRPKINAVLPFKYTGDFYCQQEKKKVQKHPLHREAVLLSQLNYLN